MGANSVERADYVIVGAGSAGCVLAEHLTRNGRHTVTILEAGGHDNRFWLQVPLGYGRTFYDPAVNWMYDTEADPGLGGRSDYWPRGKVLGGSSSINAMVYIRGQRVDFDDWAALGNPGWAWRDVGPIFDSLEGRSNLPNGSHGSGSPTLHISDVSHRAHPLSRLLLDAGHELGLHFNEDFNGETQEGVGYYRLTTTRNSLRNSAARAFLRPACKRQNLRIVTHAHAEKIDFREGRATGISYRKRGQLRHIAANREVIVASGAIGSPQLLQLSGIGDADHLKALGIDMVRHNANVGAHLQDHLGVSCYYRATVPTLNNTLGTWPRRIMAGAQYILTGQGPLGMSINQTGGFFRTPGSTRANMQLYCQVLTTTSVTGARPLLMPDSFPAFSLGISSCRPKSRGRVDVVSANRMDAPAIQPNSFSHHDDMQEMIAGMKFMHKIAATDAFKAVTDAPIGEGHECDTDAKLEADIRARAGTVFHPSCTCRMSPDASDGVVDPRLRVHGLRDLRVVDASIFPTVTSGNLNAPSMMVGAKGAEMILEDAT